MSHSSRDSAGQALASPALVRALQYLLGPLVRLLISSHVTYPFLSNLLKRVYVETAEADLASEGPRPSDSRLSLLTGVHRKDVKRLRAEGGGEYRPPPSVSLGARLVAEWTGTPAFLDRNGHPRALNRVADQGESPSFEELVSSVSTDIRPRAVLDEWLRLGIVEVEDGDRIRLRVEAFVPSTGFDEKAHYFGRNLHDHVATAAHNLEGGAPPMLERSVYYDQLSPESVAELADLAEQAGMEALQQVNRRALDLQRRDVARGRGHLRLNFGVYFFRGRMTARPGEDGGEDA